MYNYLYFVKCVSTTETFLDLKKPAVSTNMYSVTSHERSVEGGMDPDHAHAMHARGGIPGVFFQYDISPMRVLNRERRQGSLGEFLSASVAIIGGVLVIGQMMDRIVFEGNKVMTLFVYNN